MLWLSPTPIRISAFFTTKIRDILISQLPSERYNLNGSSQYHLEEDDDPPKKRSIG
jgi:hypothetical protein